VHINNIFISIHVIVKRGLIFKSKLFNNKGIVLIEVTEASNISYLPLFGGAVGVVVGVLLSPAVEYVKRWAQSKLARKHFNTECNSYLEDYESEFKHAGKLLEILVARQAGDVVFSDYLFPHTQTFFSKSLVTEFMLDRFDKEERRLIVGIFDETRILNCNLKHLIEHADKLNDVDPKIASDLAKNILSLAFTIRAYLGRNDQNFERAPIRKISLSLEIEAKRLQYSLKPRNALINFRCKARQNNEPQHIPECEP